MIFFSIIGTITGPTRATWRHVRALGAAFLLFACEHRAAGPSESVSSHPPPEASGPNADDGGPAARLPDARDPHLRTADLVPFGADADVEPLRIVPFAWRPPRGSVDAYLMDEAEDQHRIVLPRGAARGALPVVVAFHGQPRRGEAPRNYAFARRVIDTTTRALERGEVQPFVLVLPVFRYFGTNWPEFDVEAFRGEIERRLSELGIEARGFYMVGHSGAAGCGGDGMNRAHRMHPAAVGFFDTCLGRGWRDEVERLRAARIPTLMVHSLETAGFTPRQATEYLPTFDFGRAYGPAGLSPSACPAELPAAKLRDQPFRCSSDERAVTRGLIVDSGEGEDGHNALVAIALEYFLKQYVGTR